MWRLRSSSSSADHHTTTSWTGLLRILLLAQLFDLQLQLLWLTESSEITRSIRHHHGRRGCRKLLLQLLLVMAGRRWTHFKRRTRPSGCHLLLSVARIGHGRVMMRRLTRVGKDLLTRPFLASLPFLTNHDSNETTATTTTTTGTGTCFIIMNGGCGQRGQRRR